jgi:hypothetical protein
MTSKRLKRPTDMVLLKNIVLIHKEEKVTGHRSGVVWCVASFSFIYCW